MLEYLLKGYYIRKRKSTVSEKVSVPKSGCSRALIQTPQRKAVRRAW
ncbi:hypothetical protein ANACOL_04204 [Anaerotruncus colihominis DSM 17241]|uniref:Uncharacterized protein n=1 Tax=Anaerotruncus colihominis DSM 17241 TaxID=445972 RepID=B0PHB4_9FIRM|nr:hypothetical protein ANACOL_04204 [Anaerotruncus colihominis DSM 17241]